MTANVHTKSGFLCICLSLLVGFSEAQPVAMTPADIVALPSAGDGQLSPDGNYLLYSVSSVDWQKNKRIKQLWRLDQRTGEARQLTLNENSSTPSAWSPDGKFIVFTSKRDDDKHTQIYLLPNDGGEALKLTNLPAAPRNIRWQTGTNNIFFILDPIIAKPTEEKRKQHKIIEQFEDSEQHRTLWRFDLSTKRLEQVSPNNRTVFDYDFAPNTELVLISSGPGIRIDQRHSADLWLLDKDGNLNKQITANNHYEKKPRYSPDGRWLAYLSGVNEKGENYYNSNLFLVDTLSLQTRLLAQQFVGEIEDFNWSQDGNALFFTANTGLSTHLYRYELGQSLPEQLTTGERTIKYWHYADTRDEHVVKFQDATDPGELWLFLASQSLSQLTSVHQGIAERFQLPQQTSFKWQGHDKQWIEGLLTYPLDYLPGQPFPLVVQTHGGPRSSDQFGIWSSTDYMPVLAAHGYGVFATNHRGSAGYTDEFLRDMLGGYFTNAHLDVLSGIDALVEKGLADPGKLVKMGWSAGGHMTNKLITHTSRFKAAASGAGSVDWLSQYGETDTSYNRTGWFSGTPWQEDAPIDRYRDNSVVQDLWKVKTPTLIFVGEKDVRVPATQSKILFRALRDLGIETELYIAPDEPHGFKKPSHRLFKINKELEWFERHVHGRDYQHQTVPDRSEQH